jgi:hypothetical protein
VYEANAEVDTKAMAVYNSSSSLKSDSYGTSHKKYCRNNIVDLIIFVTQNGAARPVESIVLLDEIEAAAAAADEDKRQFDDYGHMRFGKRGPTSRVQPRAFDDYGHMRFGRAGRTLSD